MEWNKILPETWKGPIVVRCIECFQNLGDVLAGYDKHVIHNGLLILFALHSLPRGFPTQATCAKAVTWAMPEASSALLIEYYSAELLQNAIQRVEVMFESLKAHIKRAPTLRGRALVQLSALKIMAQPWPDLYNQTYVTELLAQVNFASNNKPRRWFQSTQQISIFFFCSLNSLLITGLKMSWKFIKFEMRCLIFLKLTLLWTIKWRKFLLICPNDINRLMYDLSS